MGGSGTRSSLRRRAARRRAAVVEDRHPEGDGRRGRFGQRQGSPRVYLFVFFRIPPFAGNEISAKISPKFANSERKGTSNSKNEIPMNSDRNFGNFRPENYVICVFPTVPEVK